MTKKQLALSHLLVLIGTLILSACQPKTVVIEREVTRVVIEEKAIEHTVEVEQETTKIVKEIVEIEVTPTPTPISQGGFLKRASVDDVQILNPLFSTDGPSAEIQGYIFATPFEVDPWTGETIPGLVESWEIGDGNHTVTYHVRRGMQWSDGEAITARDFMFTLEALMARDDNGDPVLPDSPHLDRVQHVERVELVDDHALRVTFTSPSCTHLEDLNLAWLPAHIFLSDPDFQFADLADHDFNWQPTVFSGPFMLQEWVRGDQIILARNPEHWKGEPYLDGIVWQVVADKTTEIEMLKSGESDLGDVEPRHLTEMEQVATLDIYKFLRPEYVYVALQQGDPENPQPRLNEDGTVNENHGAHPILSSRTVRQALAHAIDRTSIINRALMGQGAPLHAHIVPLYRWAYHDGLEPRDYDPGKAMEMLEAAGWRDEDGDGIRECHDCGTTEDGSEMTLNLRTHIDNEVYEDVGVLIQQQLIDVGVEVEFEPMEWYAFQDKLLGQTFDMAIVGFRGVVPDGEAFFDARGDVPGNGLNFCSFYQPDYERLQLQAKTVEGCSYEDRGAAYREIQEIMREEQPYIWLYVPRTLTIINKRLGNVNPGPWSATHNIHEWFVKS